MEFIVDASYQKSVNKGIQTNGTGMTRQDR